ncbi:MAG: UDP-N-acetylmuramate:L-alanyl-gamma-D-glutamyl-meso-diaminopimelate ligase [Myxococcales bacterium]|nr:UDP-N-acetylmuramate:L-alanyl-gamma-D-glutamyl-meso-diaminopimelate ligase [Myxococcales bacterium]
MKIHFVGVAGTGMGSAAGLMVANGHDVSGSDTHFHPPIGDTLPRWGVRTMEGFQPGNLDPAPDLVVIGNVCRATNPEARAAIDRGLPYLSLPGLLEQEVLAHRRNLVVAGTHGKTTSTALLAWLLSEAGADPGFMVGGLPRNFDRSFAIGHDGGPFVIEGDEYDSAFFEKKPKFWRYHPHAALLTSVEFDHIDIYPDEASYDAAFQGFLERMEPGAVLVAYAGDPGVRKIARQSSVRTVYYGLDGDDCGDVTPTWFAAKAPIRGGLCPFDLFVGGSSLGRAQSPLMGDHNLRNVVGSIALLSEAGISDPTSLMRALPAFAGVRRRQERIGEAGGVTVYDDFAHHPTAIRETLRGFRDQIGARGPGAGRLIALFEPRSATASRRVHQEQYPDAFQSADTILLAPVGRPEIAPEERIDTDRIASTLRARGKSAHAEPDLDRLVDRACAEARPGDIIVAMSNGDFGGIHDRILAALALKGISRRTAPV